MSWTSDWFALREPMSNPFGRPRVIAVLLLALAISLGSAGCGSGSGANPGPTPNPTPTVAMVSPNSAPAGAAGFTLTVNGSNFITASTVQWNGSNRATTFVSSSQLQAQIMAADLASGATVTVTVVNPSPGGGNSNGVVFTVMNPTPTLTTILPNSAPAGALAFTLTVNGSNFLPAAQVEWNGSSRTTTFVSSSQLQAHIMAVDLAAAGEVTVSVVNPAPGGGSSKAATFIIAPDTIAFNSARALDGTDAANTNSTLNIWVMNADGSSPKAVTRMTALGESSGDQAWSPNGGKIAFASSRALDGSNAGLPNGTNNIWVVNADGTGATHLTGLTALSAISGAPRWSPDGGKIVFESQRALDGGDAANSIFNIWVVNADGSGAAPLTKLTAVNANSDVPVWSPDGSKIVFISVRALDGTDAVNTNNTQNIWVMKADGSGAAPLTKITAIGAVSFTPVWSPDGSKIVFTSQRALDGSNAALPNFTNNIWVVNADGSGATHLTGLTAVNAGSFNPVWSPDGSKVMFDSSRALDGSDTANTNNTHNIWVVNADGSGATHLTGLTAVNAGSFNPVWSPDGSKVMFDSSRALDGSDASNTNFTLNIWVMNADGTSATHLTGLTAAGAGSLAPVQP